MLSNSLSTIFLAKMSTPSDSPPRESIHDFTARLSNDFFNPIPSTYPQSSSQMLPPNYTQTFQQNPQEPNIPYYPQQPPQMSTPYYPNDPNIFIPQTNAPYYPPQTYAGTSSGIGSSSQFTTPIGSTPSPSVPEIQAEEEVDPQTQSAQQVAPTAEPATKKKKNHKSSRIRCGMVALV